MLTHAYADLVNTIIQKFLDDEHSESQSGE